MDVAEVNGVSLAEIERRSLPISDNTTDETWRCRSFDGFLGAHESLKGVIDADKRALASLNVGMTELLSEMRICMSKVDASLGDRHAECRIAHKGRELVATKRWFMSPQFSLFYNPEAEGSEWNVQWNVEYEFRAPEGMWVRIGGSREAGVLQYMETLGFCEGGHPANPYRVDPFLAAAVFLAKYDPRVADVWRERLEHQREEELGRTIEDVTARLRLCRTGRADEAKSDEEKTKLAEEETWLTGFLEEQQHRLAEKQRADDSELAAILAVCESE